MAGVIGQVPQVTQEVYNTIVAGSINQYPYLVRSGNLRPTYVTTSVIYVAYFINAGASTYPHSALFYSRDSSAVMKHGIQSANGDFNGMDTMAINTQDGDNGWYLEIFRGTYGNPQFTAPISPFPTREEALAALRAAVPAAAPAETIVERLCEQR